MHLSLALLPVLLASTRTTTSINTPKPSPLQEEPTPLWLVDRLRRFDLQVSHMQDTGRGLQTTRDRSAQEEENVILAVPEHDAVTATKLLEAFSSLEQAVQVSRREKEEEDAAIQLPLTEEQVLAMGLLLLRHQGDPYITGCLPKEQYSVLNASDAVLLCLPRAYQKVVKAYQSHVKDLHQSLLQCINDGDEKELVTEEQDFQWAFATVRSRCVGMDGKVDDRILTNEKEKIRVLLPGFDLLNHKFGAQAIRGQEDGEYVVRTRDAYRAGEQVFISYGDDRDNLQMLMTYGFCCNDNPQAVAFFDSHDLLGACARARPSFFTPPVLQQLHGLMEKQGNQHNLFVYDGKQKQPEWSLANSIAMMAEIEKQFVTEPDTTFSEHLLDALLASRKEEIASGLDMAQQVTAIDGWIPMLESIRTLISAEHEYLGTKDAVA